MIRQESPRFVLCVEELCGINFDHVRQQLKSSNDNKMKKEYDDDDDDDDDESVNSAASLPLLL